MSDVDWPFIPLASRVFGNPPLAREIAFKIDLAVRMKRGADAQRRPAIRRDKLEAVAKTIRRLQAHLSELDVLTIADIMGRVAPRPPRDDDDDVLPDRVSAPVPSQTPALLQEFAACCLTLETLAAGSLALSNRQGGIRRGAEQTPDALMFALEGLEAIWKQSKGISPEILSFKAGGFGDFALQAMALSDGVFSEPEVRTGLRRLHELRHPAG